MKNSVWWIAPLSVCLLSAGCRNAYPEPEAGTPNSNGVLSFNAEVDGSSATGKGVSVDEKTMSDMGVFCFHTGRDKYNVVVPPVDFETRMYDLRVARNDQGKWVYDPPVAWGGKTMDYFSFFSYAPHATGSLASGGNGLLVPVGVGSSEVPRLEVEINPDVRKQFDVLAGVPQLNIFAQPEVRMRFTHLLCRLEFKVFKPSALDKYETIVTSVSLENVYNKAQLRMTQGFPVVAGSVTSGSFTLGGLSVLLPSETQSISLSVPDGYFLMFPSTLSAPTARKIVVTYTERFIGSTAPPAVRKAEYVFKEEWKSGVALAYTMQMGEQAMAVVRVDEIPWVTQVQDPLNPGVPLKGKVWLHFHPNGFPVALSKGSVFDLPSALVQLPVITKLSPSTDKATYRWNTKANGTGTFIPLGGTYTLPADVAAAPTTLYVVNK